MWIKIYLIQCAPIHNTDRELSWTNESNEATVWTDSKRVGRESFTACHGVGENTQHGVLLLVAVARVQHEVALRAAAVQVLAIG